MNLKCEKNKVQNFIVEYNHEKSRKFFHADDVNHLMINVISNDVANQKISSKTY